MRLVTAAAAAAGLGGAAALFVMKKTEAVGLQISTQKEVKGDRSAFTATAMETELQLSRR